MKKNSIRTMMILLIMIVESCKVHDSDVSYQNPRLTVSVSHYSRFCFDNGLCTEYRLVRYSRRMIKKRTVVEEKEYQTENYTAIDPMNKSDSSIIDQFLQSLRVYNLSSQGSLKKRSRVTITKDLFFIGDSFKTSYRHTYEDGNFVELYGLESLGRSYDFKYKVTEKLVDDNYYSITFDESPDVEIRCSPNFYNQVLFNCQINFLSKNHRLTPCILGIKPIDLGY